MQNYFFEMSPLALVYFSSLLFWGNPDRVRALILAVMVHEGAHLLSLAAFRCRIFSVKLRLNGLCIEYSGNESLWEVLILNMSGPVGGVLFYMIGRFFPNCLPPWLSMSCRISLFLSVFNSMPVYPLDGGYAVKELLAFCLKPDDTEKVIRYFSFVFSVFFILSGLLFILKNSGFGLLIAGIWLLCANISA